MDREKDGGAIVDKKPGRFSAVQSSHREGCRGRGGGAGAERSVNNQKDRCEIIENYSVLEGKRDI